MNNLKTPAQKIDLFGETGMQNWKNGESKTSEFYDSYWPHHIPDLENAREHTLRIVPNRRFSKVLDAGCGSGVSSIALFERSAEVVGLDLSEKSLEVAKAVSSKAGKKLNVVCGSLMNIPFRSGTYDLIYCYGVVSLTADPYTAISELTRVLRKDGCIVLAVTQKTNLSALHTAVHRLCLRMPTIVKTLFLKTASALIVLIARGRGLQSKDYKLSVQDKLEDFYFVPYKHYFDLGEIERIFEEHNMVCKVICTNTGRFKSSSNFVVMGTYG